MTTERSYGSRRNAVPKSGFVLGLVIGIAIWLPIALFGADLLAESVGSLLAGSLIAIVFVGVLGCVAYVARTRILSVVFGKVTVSVGAATEAALTAIESWPSDRVTAASSAAQAVKEASASLAWFLTQRTVITVILSLIGAIIALAGTTLLLRQTAALQLQNEKLDRQIEIMAGQGQWELFWELHHSSDPSVRMAAAAQLAPILHERCGVGEIFPYRRRNKESNAVLA